MRHTRRRVLESNGDAGSDWRPAMKSIKQCEWLQVGDPTGTPQFAAPRLPLPPPTPPICSHFVETVRRLGGTHSPFRQDFDPQPAGERVVAKVTVPYPSSPFPLFLSLTHTCYIIFVNATLFSLKYHRAATSLPTIQHWIKY